MNLKHIWAWLNRRFAPYVVRGNWWDPSIRGVRAQELSKWGTLEEAVEATNHNRGRFCSVVAMRLDRQVYVNSR